MQAVLKLSVIQVYFVGGAFFLMVDATFEIGSAKPKDFERTLLEGGVRAAAASGQIRTSTGSSASASGRIPTEHDPASANSEVESENLSEKGSLFSETATAFGQNLPIVFSLAGTHNCPKIASCFLCGILANVQSPLTAGNDVDIFGGFVPWNSYTKVRDNEGVVIGKTPSGTVCKISQNCFHAIWYNVKYGTGSSNKGLKEYKKLMAKKEGREIHANFLASRKNDRQHQQRRPSWPWQIKPAGKR
jgi:hypothetical protein